MIDTGSAYSIIHINTLRKLIRQPHIIYQKKIHRTANNTELRTIGLVKLKINIRNIPTFILAEVAIDLCTSLVLGNDWIRQNRIDIINTKQCISKRQGSYVVTVPFLIYEDEAYQVLPVHRIHLLPEQNIIIPVRVKIKNADTVIFTPSNDLIGKKKIINTTCTIES
ncbi:unnamed protein product [Rotaria socialis]|nr:unnamed protein product [Rotaria socialis]